MKKTVLFKILSIFLCLIFIIEISVYATNLDSLISNYKNVLNDNRKGSLDRKKALSAIEDSIENEITKENIDKYIDEFEEKQKSLQSKINSSQGTRSHR